MENMQGRERMVCSMKKYAIGIDYGTLSGRAVLVDIADGSEAASAVYDYPHGVMDTRLPCGTPLPPDYALQHPRDYIDVLTHTIPEILKDIDPKSVVGVGTDFTACTVLPVDGDGVPLCFYPEFEQNPHAYVKLWKHHAAQPQANTLNKLASNQAWLRNYGGKISSEWAVPKVMELVQQAPEVYDAMARFEEAGDWIVRVLTGNETKNACAAGYKWLYNKKVGYPQRSFYASLDPKLENFIAEKVCPTVSPLGSCAGGISEAAAKLTGLRKGTSVSVGNVDAHVCLPAVGISGVGKLLAIMGTSTCHIIMSDRDIKVPGICGVVEDGVLPGLFAYEAGQSCVGDHFSWFIQNCLPEDYKKHGNAHQFLREKAQALAVGESGLVALDWWNGNRSVLVDVDLTGMIAGMTLQTKPEEIYRALIEATAYGTRMIVDNFRENGLAVDVMYASGGISQKDPLMMQIYADVLNIPVVVAAASQGPALGSAIFGAVAGKAYPTVEAAIAKMGAAESKTYMPNAENARVYQKLFYEYRMLHDYFGRGGNDVMKRLKEIKKCSKS